MTSAKEFIHVGNSVKLAKLYGCPKLQGTQKKCFWESYIFFFNKMFPEVNIQLEKDEETIIFQNISKEKFTKVAGLPIAGVKLYILDFYDGIHSEIYRLHVSGCGPDSWKLNVKFC